MFDLWYQILAAQIKDLNWDIWTLAIKKATSRFSPRLVSHQFFGQTLIIVFEVKRRSPVKIHSIFKITPDHWITNSFQGSEHKNVGRFSHLPCRNKQQPALSWFRQAQPPAQGACPELVSASSTTSPRSLPWACRREQQTTDSKQITFCHSKN